MTLTNSRLIKQKNKHTICTYGEEPELMMDKVELNHWHIASVNNHQWWFVQASVYMTICILAAVWTRLAAGPGLSPVRPPVNHQRQRRGSWGGGIQRQRSEAERCLPAASDIHNDCKLCCIQTTCISCWHCTMYMYTCCMTLDCKFVM